MAQKHLLTVFHCVIALVVTAIGTAWASTAMERQPVAALITAFASIVLPVAIATRVAWASGYAAGIKAAPGTVSNDPPLAKKSASDTRIQRITHGPDT